MASSAFSQRPPGDRPRPGVQRRALFLDRDGTINHDPGYTWRIEDCAFIDGIFEAAAAFHAAGFAIVIATNQAGIGRGYYSEADYHRLMRWIEGEFGRCGVPIAASYFCPDHPTEGIGRYRRDNAWRKPGSGMFLQAARDLGLDMAASWCVGDKETDIMAGRGAGIGTLVHYDAAATALRRNGDCWIVPRLGDLLELLRRRASS